MTTTSPPANPTRTSDTSELRSPSTQLKIAAAIAIGFGLLLALGSFSGTDAPFRFMLDLVFQPYGDSTTITEETRVTTAVAGGVLVGFGALYWLLVDTFANSHPHLVRKLIIRSIICWFVIDSAGSIASGGWLNVIGNLGFLALFVLPARRLG